MREQERAGGARGVNGEQQEVPPLKQKGYTAPLESSHVLMSSCKNVREETLVKSLAG